MGPRGAGSSSTRLLERAEGLAATAMPRRPPILRRKDPGTETVVVGGGRVYTLLMTWVVATLRLPSEPQDSSSALDLWSAVL